MVIAERARQVGSRRPPADSTLRDLRPVRRRAVLSRRIGLLVLLLVVVLGATGAFGVRSATTSVSQRGYMLSVTYPRVARAGLDVPVRVHVHHPGGYPSALSVAVSSDYFEMYETQGFFPEPDSESNDGRFVTLTFSKPSGDDFQVEYDTYIQPAAQIGKSAVVRVEIKGQVVAQVSISTWLLP
jgi:hypothetical protein